MSDRDKRNNGNMVPAGRRDLAPVAGANPLVSRAIADLAQGPFDGLDPKKQALPYFRFGLGYWENKEYDKAIKCFDKGLRLDPSNAFAYLRRGEAWFEKNDFVKAIKDFDEAIRLDPNDASAYNQRGRAWLMKGEHDKAINDFDKAMLHPKNAFAYDNYYNRGLAWYAKKEYTQAIKDFDEAIRLGPLIIVVFRLPWIERGKAWAAKGNYEKAIEDF